MTEEQAVEPGVEIPLYAKDGSIRAHVIVDAADADWVNQWRWRMNLGYAVRSERIDGINHTIILHRELLGLVRGDHMEGDHRDRNRLDCRRHNLRAMPKKGRPNMQNLPSRKGSSSQYRNVSWNAKLQKWIVSIKRNDRNIHIGYFSDEHDAGAAARAARQSLQPYSTD
jgi:hypothetical protein